MQMRAVRWELFNLTANKKQVLQAWLRSFCDYTIVLSKSQAYNERCCAYNIKHFWKIKLIIHDADTRYTYKQIYKTS